MPSTLANRAKMTVSGTPGTGTITLGSAVSGFQSFSAALGASATYTVSYTIEDSSSWEVGTGTYTTSGTTLTRTVTASSNGGTAINATSAAIVFLTALAADLQTGTSGATIPLLNGVNTWSASQTFNAATSSVYFGANGGNLGIATFYGSTSGSVSLRPAAAAGTGTIFQLPSSNGSSGQFLQTNGSGVTSWAAAGATGGSSDQIFWNNGQTVTSNYTVPASTNAGSFGPITINSGVTVEVSSGSNWVIV